ncbi:MAG: helix-turn-helix domain-containing protein [Microthrixaceae bacterium]
MPRIKADNIAEHVAHQQAAVLDAAVELFVERGYHEVCLADIASEVGLARNSLYRYVPDKAHLLLDWYRRIVPLTIEEWRTVTAGDDPPAVRLQRWARAYLAWALTPEHQLVAPLTEAMAGFDDETRAQAGALHASMMDVVASVLVDAGVSTEHVDGVLALLSGAVLGAARAEEASGADPDVRRRLDSVVAAALV